jgi:hypothetical protein
MLSLRVETVTVEPYGRGTPNASRHGRKQPCRVGVTGGRGRFRQETSPLMLFRGSPQGYPPLKSASVGPRSGEYRFNPLWQHHSKPLKTKGLPLQSPPFRSALHGRTWREHATSIRGKSVETFRGWFGSQATDTAGCHGHSSTPRRSLIPAGVKADSFGVLKRAGV